MTIQRIIVLISLILYCPVYSPATVLHVPSEYSTIQDGINAAIDGDTVLVAPGTYTGTGGYYVADFLGKAILVTSEMGPGSTFLEEAFKGAGFGAFSEFFV